LTHVPPVRGRRLAIVTNSGGPGVLAADRAEAAGFQLAEPSPALREKLSKFLPPYCALKNPIDLTVEGTQAGYRDTLSAVLEEYDAALALDVSTPYLDTVALARGVVAAAEASGKPVAASFMAGRIVVEAVDYLKAHGVTNFATGERAVNVLARMADYQAWAANRRPAPEKPGASKKLPGHGRLLEPEAMAWLRDNGLPAPDFRFVTRLEDVKDACCDVGFPVVMKVVSPAIVHKSESGGVKLGLRDDTEARAAFEAIRLAAAGKDFRGVIVTPQIRGGQEVLLGLSRDAQFGPVVMFGLGGIFTEVLRDIALRVAPLDRPEADAMLREVRAFPILQGARGQPGCDLDALADTLVSFSRLPFLYPELAEVDLNPVFALPEGLVVGDVRVIRKDQESL